MYNGDESCTKVFESACLTSFLSSDDDDGIDAEGAVIPLQFLGVTDINLNHISLDEWMKFTLANMQDSEGGYIVRHGLQPLSKFRTGYRDQPNPKRNHLATAFPVLFPYRIGGIKGRQECTIGFDEHVQWALQYHDW